MAAKTVAAFKPFNDLIGLSGSNFGGKAGNESRLSSSEYSEQQVREQVQSGTIRVEQSYAQLELSRAKVTHIQSTLPRLEENCDELEKAFAQIDEMEALVAAAAESVQQQQRRLDAIDRIRKPKPAAGARRAVGGVFANLRGALKAL